MGRRSYGGGDRGHSLRIGFKPNSALITHITSLINAGSKVEGTHVTIDTSAAYTVGLAADDAIPDGQIVAYENDNYNTYHLTIDLETFADQNGNRYPATRIRNKPYSGSIALGDTVIINGSTAKAVDDGTTGGFGKVLAVDVPASGYADILL